MYRRVNSDPKTAWAHFLRRMRKDRDWSQTEAHEELYAGLKLARSSRAVYVALDNGDRPPKPDEETFLRSYFGEGPTEADERAVAGSGEDATKLDPAALLERLDDYAELVNKLLDQNAKLMAMLTDRQPELPPDLVPTMLRWAAAHMPPEPTEPRLPTANHPDEPGQ